MSNVQSIFGIKQMGTLTRPERQSIEQTEDYAVKDVIITQELIAGKIWLDKASDTYFVYNGATSEVDLYVGGTIRASF